MLPAVLVPYVKKYEPEEEKVLDALYTAAGIGQVIAADAYIAGQAAAVRQRSVRPAPWRRGLWWLLHGGSEKAIIHAAAMAIKNLLGLVCDRWRGLWRCPA